jgi:hypothetical protein
MPRRIENQKVYRRYRNGGCVIDRICCGCGDAFIGERNICPACRNLKRRRSRKFGADYHRDYYRSNLSKSAMLHQNGSLAPDGDIAELRQAAWEKQRDRIWAELAAGAE